MDITPLIPEGLQIVEAYGNNGFKVTDQRYKHSVIVFPDKTQSAEKIIEFSDINAASLQPILCRDDDVEILIVGCGEKLQFFSPELQNILRSKRIVPEMMDTGAACRTYNVLLTEGRSVAALLIPIL